MTKSSVAHVRSASIRNGERADQELPEIEVRSEANGHFFVQVDWSDDS